MMSAPNNSNSNKEQGTPLADDAQGRLADAIALKDYAIANNYDVPNEIIDKLNRVRLSQSEKPSADNMIDIDTIIRDLTHMTYPTTIQTLKYSGTGEDSKGLKLFKNSILYFSIVLIIAAIFSYDSALEQNVGKYDRVWDSLLAICLGVLGAVVYIMFNLVGIIAERAFNPEDTYANYVRIVLGALVGWLVFIITGGDAFDAAGRGDKGVDSQDSEFVTNLLVFLPFLAGFSSRLVVGLINQAIRAVQLTLGIEEKDEQLLARRLRRKSSSEGRSPPT